MANAASRKTLSGRLFAAFFSLALAILLLSVAAVVAASWSVYEGDAEDRLLSQTEATAGVLAEMNAETQQAYLSTLELADTRVTLVAGDGLVLFDSVADAASMPNHANREEIAMARNTGESAVMRRSETTGSDTLYAAVFIPESDAVIRLAETRTSLPYYMGSIAMPLAGILLLALLLSVLLARLIAKKIASPLVDVDLEDPLSCDAYSEVMPLLERVEAQKIELMEKNQELSDAFEVRREFTSNVSHEMKSPLQVIGGYAELIESGITSEGDTKRFAGLISSEARSMRTLIDDVLTLSRLDEMPMDTSTVFDMAAVASSAVERLQSTAHARNICINLDCPSPAKVQGSTSLAEHMVYNLVDNAIRYGRENGTVEVSAQVQDGFVQVTVGDDGPGVPEESRERIFERFYRMDASRSRDTGGTGLGLAIVKHAAISMGGTVHADQSRLGGLAITATIPLAPTTSETQQSE